jgi:hypothetical protein
MSLKHFTYTKESGEVSNRVVYPLRIVDDKLLSIDVSELSDKEREEAIIVLDAIHKKYISDIKNAGFGSKFRYFFVDQMSIKQ